MPLLFICGPLPEHWHAEPLGLPTMCMQVAAPFANRAPGPECGLSGDVQHSPALDIGPDRDVYLTWVKGPFS